MADILELVDLDELRHQVRQKYRDVAADPSGIQHAHHFHTGRAHAVRLGYPSHPLGDLTDEACEAFAGVGNPFYWGGPKPGERVVDLGSGAGMDSLLASLWVGSKGKVIGVDMTPEMLERSRSMAEKLGLKNVEFREGLIEDLPVEDGWADVVISNGVINLCPDKIGVYREIFRVLKPGGRMTVADICLERPVPEEALRDIDLWTGWIAGALPCAGWETVITGAGLVDVELANPLDTFAGASGEASAREFGTLGYSIRARKQAWLGRLASIERLLHSEGYRQIFSEKNARGEAKRYRRKGLDGTSRRIADIVKARGFEGGTLLEVGGGIGAIEIELLKAGVAWAVNVELTPTYEAAAGELLQEAGLADRVERRVMDFVDVGTEVDTADIVVMNRVICCNPDMPKLAGAAAERAKSMLVMSFPNNRWWTRLGLTFANFGFRVIKMQFRVFLHPPVLILAAVEQHGFRTRFNELGLLWQVTAFERIAWKGRGLSQVRS